MNIERVAIIGAGPCGLGAAKYFLAEKHFRKITLFEQRNQPGGVWNYTGNTGTDVSLSIPSPAPSTTPQEPIDGVFVSPVYDSLETNIPKSMMQFCETPFHADTALFPPHAVVREYLHRYAEDIKDLIKLEASVLDVSMIKNGQTEWRVKWKDLKTGSVLEECFDAVIVANGHHNEAKIPAIPGMKEWANAFPGSISHSSTYRRPEHFTDKKVIVVGHSASGIDIAFQIGSVSKRPLLISERTETVLTPEKAAIAKALPEISRFDASSGTVVFVDGHEEKDVDHIVSCTGYHFSVPFLSSLEPSVVTDGVRPHHLYQHVFYTPEPTLALIGFPQRIVPFPFSQAQGAWIARVFSGRLTLPSHVEMNAWIEERKVTRGEGHLFNVLAFPLDAEYINLLHSLSSSATKRDGLENNGTGKAPPFWGEKEKWTRERFPLIKKASQALGSRRSQVKSLSELGFTFENSEKAHL